MVLSELNGGLVAQTKVDDRSCRSECLLVDSQPASQPASHIDGSRERRPLRVGDR